MTRQIPWLRVLDPLFVIPAYNQIYLDRDLYDISSDDDRFLMVHPLQQTREVILVQNFFEDLKRLVPN